MISFNTQRYRLTAILFTLVTILLSILLWGVMATSQSGQELRTQTRQEILLDFISTICRRALLTNEYTEAQIFVDHLLRDPHIEKIILTDHKARILVSSSYADIGESFLSTHLTAPTWQFTPIANAAGPMGNLAVLFSNAEMVTATQELRRTALLLALPILLVVAGIAWLLGSTLSRRLELLTQSVEQVSKGDLNTRIPATGSDEIGNLARMLNTMIENLQSSFDKINIEITERKLAEAALEKERNFLNTLFNTIEEGIVACDADGILTRFNKATEHFHGLPAHNLSPEEWADYYALYYPDRQTPMKKEEIPLFRALQGEHIRNVEMMIIPKNAQPRLLVANGQPLRKADDTIFGAVVSMHDITDKKRAMEELSHSHDLMRYIIEHNRSAIAVHDRDLNYIYVSQSYLDDYKIKEQDIIGKHHYDVFPDLPQKWRDVHQKALAGEVSSAEADPYEREDGSIEWTRWECRPWYGSDGSVGGIIVYTEVVTERKKVEEELKQYRDHLQEQVLERTLDLDETQSALLNLLDDMNMAKEQLEAANKKLQDLDRLKSMFIASMSHELRTPLNSVIGFSSILIDEWLGPLNDEQKMNMASILRSGKHLLSLINDVIDISKIEAGTLEPQIESFDLADLLTEAEDFVRKSAEDKGLVLIIHKFSYHLLTDRRRLLQILINFLSNGVKFTDTGEVTLTARLSEDQKKMEISVVDTGLGIKEQDKGKLFQPFSRLHDSGSSVYPGTGLGLYLCRKIAVEILYGEVDIQSIFGQGSTFRVILPVKIES